MFSFICAWMNGWADNREAGELRRHHAHYDVTVMIGPTLEERHLMKLHITACAFFQAFIVLTKIHKNGLINKNGNMFCQQTMRATKICEWYRTILVRRALCTICENLWCNLFPKLYLSAANQAFVLKAVAQPKNSVVSVFFALQLVSEYRAMVYILLCRDDDLLPT